jgi:hypothetical protein
MSELFILQNQDKLFFGKQKDWLDGRDPGSLYKTLHKDEAINQLVEVSSKDYTQRIKVLACAANEKGLPMIDAELLPPPQPKVSKAQTALALDPEPELDEPELEPDALAEEELEFTTDAEPKDKEDSQTSLL